MRAALNRRPIPRRRNGNRMYLIVSIDLRMRLKRRESRAQLLRKLFELYLFGFPAREERSPWYRTFSQREINVRIGYAK